MQQNQTLNFPMQQNQSMQQNYQMQQNQQMQQNNPMPQNFSMQPNYSMPQNEQMQQNNPMPQNYNMQQNYFMPQDQQMQPVQQNQSMQPMQQNQPMQPMQQNQMQQRQLPPLPKNAGHNLPHYTNQQRIPLNGTSMQQTNGSFMGLQSSSKFSSMQSMQSMDSSDDETTSSQPQPSQDQNKTFPVIYNNITYMVDPELLMEASLKFKELLNPYISSGEGLETVHLEVLGHNFSYRDMNNFLKLCQNLPSDVQNSEMKDICEIAKMFQAEKIYSTGVQFIQENIDSSFSVPDNKYDGSDGKRYLLIEDENHVINHSSELENDFEQNDNGNESNDKENVNNSPNKEETNTEEKPKDEENLHNIHSVIYRVRRENHTFKCPVFRFYNDGNVLYTAKQKGNNIFIGEGYDVHISSNVKSHVAHIYQDDAMNNIVFLKDMNYKMKYVNSGKPNHLSISVTFPYKDKTLTWVPKPPKYDAIKDKYYLNFHGEHHHSPIRSRKNIVLQNPSGHTTFIVRKMDNDMFEIECLPLIDPLIAFTICLSDIVGPYLDPLAEIDF